MQNALISLQTLFILLGSFLLLVIWALIVTLTVLCKKKPEQDKSNENEELDDDDEEDTKIMEEKSTSPDIKSQLSLPIKEEIPQDNYVPLGAVKLWYV